MKNSRQSRMTAARLAGAGVLVLFALSNLLAASSAQRPEGSPYYLPLVAYNLHPPAPDRTVNVPYHNVDDIIGSRFRNMEVFWFGEVRTDTNYVDVRVGYNNTHLVVHATIFDRLLWYNAQSNGANLTNWDSVMLTLHTDPKSSGRTPSTRSFRFDGQLIWWETKNIEKYKAAYQGDGRSWVLKPIAFTSEPGWRGNAPNDDQTDHGWTITYKIPFSSLGLAGPPSNGTEWRFGIQVNDRDSRLGGMVEAQFWPEYFHVNQPQTWGKLHFGLPEYTPAPAANIRQTMVRHKLNGAVVRDAGVGGGMNGGGGADPWKAWGNLNYAGKDQFNIQNQQDVSDWPHFSKYYVTFPLQGIPPGKVIRSATLHLYQFGGSLPSDAYPSTVQVSLVNEDWSEAALTWNNAPMALENVSRAQVPVFTGDIVWPGEKRSWDLSYAVAKIYGSGDSLRLAIYSADSAMHSGKYFTSSDTGDWNQAGRPTLVVEWGDPY